MKNIILLICLALGVGLLASCEKEDKIKMIRVDFYKEKGRAEVIVKEVDGTSRKFTMNPNDEFDLFWDNVSAIEFTILSQGTLRVNGELFPLYRGEKLLWDKSRYKH